MNNQTPLLTYCLRLGDNALIQSYRLSEWCSNGPILEEDLALTNFALDMTGRADLLLAYAATLEGKGQTSDSLAYRRPEKEYLNCLIHELPDEDFAFTMVRLMLTSAYDMLLYSALEKSPNENLAAIAAKAIKETRYHFAHAAGWVERLGDGTAESNRRTMQALTMLWPFTGEMFETDSAEQQLAADGIIPDITKLKESWMEKVAQVLKSATLEIPALKTWQTGGRTGRHTENLGHILCEMQYLQRAYPDATW